MNERSTQHTTFVIERTFPASPARVYKAWADPAAKARWFSGPHDAWTLLEREQDFRVGGRERVRGAFKDGPVSHFDAIYHDLVEGRRIVYSYRMLVDEVPISVSLATVTLEPGDAGGTRFTFTEQVVFLDGYDDSGKRKMGSAALFDQLGVTLAEEGEATTDREVVSTRLLAATPGQVFAAFADPARLARFWGPKGFSNTIEELDFRAGGHWRLVMHGPDGRNYPNHSVFEEIVPGERIVFEHQPPHHFRMEITLEPQGEQTLIRWRMTFDSPEACAASRPIVVPSNEENFDRLEAELARS